MPRRSQTGQAWLALQSQQVQRRRDWGPRSANYLRCSSLGDVGSSTSSKHNAFLQPNAFSLKVDTLEFTQASWKQNDCKKLQATVSQEVARLTCCRVKLLPSRIHQIQAPRRFVLIERRSACSDVIGIRAHTHIYKRCAHTTFASTRIYSMTHQTRVNRCAIHYMS